MQTVFCMAMNASLFILDTTKFSDPLNSIVQILKIKLLQVCLFTFIHSLFSDQHWFSYHIGVASPPQLLLQPPLAFHSDFACASLEWSGYLVTLYLLVGSNFQPE